MMNADSKPSPNRNSDQLRVAGHVVGLFDILGQRDILRSWTTPRNNAPETKQLVLDQLKRTYSVVHLFRTEFRKAFEAFLVRPEPPTDLPGERLELWNSLKSEPLKLFGFSDTVVAHLCVAATPQSQSPTRGVYGICAATALMQLFQLARGNPIRGGIDVDLGFEIDTDEIYGPALLKAYGLESEIAGYPRVVVGDELLSWIRDAAALPADNEVHKVNAMQAKQTLKDFVCVDIDNRPIIDFLGAGVKSIGDLDSRVREDVVSAAEFVSKELDRFRTSRDLKLALRYSRLQEYFVARMPSWGFT